MSGGASGAPSWTLGKNHSGQQWQNQMQKRGWTPAQITEAIQAGQSFSAANHVNPGHSATRYVHPTTGRSVVVDDATGEVIHVGGDGFLY
jgi:O-glycosyl hydrolase